MFELLPKEPLRQVYAKYHCPLNRSLSHSGCRAYHPVAEQLRWRSYQMPPEPGSSRETHATDARAPPGFLLYELVVRVVLFQKWSLMRLVMG